MQLFKLALIFTLFSSLSIAQQDSLNIKYDQVKQDAKEINEDHLTEYKEDKAFNYVETAEEDSVLAKIQRWFVHMVTKIFEFIFGAGKATGIIYFVLRVLPYILLGVLFFLLVKFFLKVNSRGILMGKQGQATVVFTDEENIIKNEDIQDLINKAIQQKNYRLAIRYSYLLVLKQLSESELIRWEQQKTNEDYIKEIEKESIKGHFETITRIYDYVWYGEFNVDALKYERLKPSFETISKSIHIN